MLFPPPTCIPYKILILASWSFLDSGSAWQVRQVPYLPYFLLQPTEALPTQTFLDTQELFPGPSLSVVYRSALDHWSAFLLASRVAKNIIEPCLSPHTQLTNKDRRLFAIQITLQVIMIALTTAKSFEMKKIGTFKLQ